MNKKGKVRDFSAVLLIVLYFFGIYLANQFKSNQEASINGATTSMINFAFFAIVAILFLIAIVKIGKGVIFQKSLEMAKSTLLSMSIEDRKNILTSEETSKDLFKNENLNAIFAKYREDACHMHEVSDYAEVDIENYINQELLEDTVGTYYLNQISGVMTGLGILGTFIGLSFGLSNFDLSGNADDIIKEIEPLMAGIKVAFHTSIYGMVYSLGFNFIYRRKLFNLRKSVRAFVSFYQDTIVPISEDGSISSLIKYQQKTCNLLEDYASRSKEFNENELIPALNDFSERVTSNQLDGLKEIVESFVKMMDESLKGSFAELGEVIKDTNEWQRKSLDEMSEVLTKIGEMALDMGEVNKTIETAATNIAGYTNEVKQMQTVVNANLMNLSVQADANKELVDKQSEYLDKISIGENQVLTAVNAIVEKVDAQTQQIQEINGQINKQLMDEVNTFTSEITQLTQNAVEQGKAGVKEVAKISFENQVELKSRYEEMEKILQDKLEQIGKVNETITNDMSKAAKELASVASSYNEQFDGRIKGTFNDFDVELSECVKHFAKTIQHVNDTVGKTKLSYDAMSDDIADKFDEMQKKLDQYLEYADKLHHDVMYKWNQLRAEMEKVD